MDKDLFKEKAKATIDDLIQKMEELEQKKEKASENMKRKINEKIDQLRQQKIELREKYNALEKATSDSWTDVRDAFLKSAEIFKNTISNISNKFG